MLRLPGNGRDPKLLLPKLVDRGSNGVKPEERFGWPGVAAVGG